MKQAGFCMSFGFFYLCQGQTIFFTEMKSSLFLFTHKNVYFISLVIFTQNRY